MNWFNFKLLIVLTAIGWVLGQSNVPLYESLSGTPRVVVMIGVAFLFVGSALFASWIFFGRYLRYVDLVELLINVLGWGDSPEVD